MEWYQYIAIFFSGAFWANAVPHFVKGICGDKFPTPFAKPPGKGLSSPVVNVTWGLFNMATGFFLGRGRVSADNLVSAGVFFAGAVVMSIMLAINFEKKHKE